MDSELPVLNFMRIVAFCQRDLMLSLPLLLLPLSSLLAALFALRVHPLAIYHLHASIGSKARGQSASAKVDYISRAGKYDGELDQVLHLEHNHLPKWAESADHFWDCVDQFERHNGRLFYEVEVALPKELDLDEQRELAHDFAEYLSSKLPSKDDARSDCAELTYSLAIHRGHQDNNPHAHIVLHERAADPSKDSPEHYFARANTKDPDIGGVPKSLAFDGKQALLDVRAEWELKVNHALERAGHEQRVDHRSFEDRGIDREPQIHLGHTVTALERSGIQTERGDELRAILERNAERELLALTKELHDARRLQDLELDPRTPRGPEPVDPEPGRSAPQRADGRADLADTLSDVQRRFPGQDISPGSTEREESRTPAQDPDDGPQRRDHALQDDPRTPLRDHQGPDAQAPEHPSQSSRSAREAEPTLPVGRDHSEQLEADRRSELDRLPRTLESVRTDVLLHPKDEQQLRHHDLGAGRDPQHGGQPRQDLDSLPSQSAQGAGRSPVLDGPQQPSTDQPSPVSDDHAAEQQRREQLQQQLEEQRQQREQQQKEREKKAVDYHVDRAHELAKRDGFQLGDRFEGQITKRIDTHGHSICVIEDQQRKLYAVVVDPKHLSLEAVHEQQAAPRIVATKLEHAPEQGERVLVVKRDDHTELAVGYPQATQKLKELEKAHELALARERDRDRGFER